MADLPPPSNGYIDTQDRLSDSEKVDPRKQRGEFQEKMKEEQDGKRQAPAQNTAIFLSNLPLDTTVRDLETEFKRYGIIAESLESNEPRIKLYNDEDGNFKGEALIVYYRPESVEQAVMLRDETDLRHGGRGTMKVKVAESNFKTHHGSTAQTANTSTKKATNKPAGLAAKKREEMERRLGDWGDEDPSAAPPDDDTEPSKEVCLLRAFTREHFQEDEDPKALKKAMADAIEDKAKAFGGNPRVTIWEKTAEGIVTILFEEAKSAEKCAAAFKGRRFNGELLNAFLVDPVINWTTAPNDEQASDTNGKADTNAQRDEGEDSEDEAERMAAYKYFKQTRGT